MVLLKKLFVLSLIFSASFLSVLNFIPPVQADVIYGTVITMTDPQMLWDYYQLYGEQYMYERWLGENLMYCLGEASNCAIVPPV